MSIRVVPPVELKTAEELCRFYRIKLKTGQALLRPELSPGEFFHRLLEQQHLADARRVLAHAMPRRKALWWACLCALDLYKPELPASVAKVLEAVCRFVQNPSDLERRSIFELRRELKVGSIEHCLATAVFFSGGSISRVDLPFVAAKPWVLGRLVSVIVYLAAVKRDPRRYKDHLRQYLAMGLEVLRAEVPWMGSSDVGQAFLPADTAGRQECLPHSSEVVPSPPTLLG